MGRYLRRLFELREFIYQAVLRDLKIRYKRSKLGPLWAILNPLLMMAVLSVAFGLFMRFNIVHYPLFLFSGLIAWQFCQTSTTECLDQLVGRENVAIYSKINVPKGIFPLAHTCSQFVNFLFALGAMLILLIAFRELHLKPLPSLIPGMFLLFIFVTGLGFLSSVSNVFFRDFKFIIPVLFATGFYVTPIVYDMSLVPEKFHPLIQLNPFTPYIELLRAPLYRGEFPSLETWGLACLWATLSFGIGLFVMTKSEDQVMYHV